MPERDALQPLIEETRSAYLFSTYMTCFAGKGIPTLALPNRALLSSNVDLQKYENSSADFLVNLYFDNVRFPSPQTAMEAMRYRDSARIENWRAKIATWQSNLNTGKLTEKEILDELTDANGYLEGATFISSTLGRFSPWIIGGCSIVTALFESIPFHTTIITALLGHSILDRAGAAIESSVYGNTPLKAEWVIIPPVE